jgi:plastocyanin
MRLRIIVAVCVALVGVPALASARDDPPLNATVANADSAMPTWDPSDVKIRTGGTVTFQVNSQLPHTVQFMPNVPCDGVPDPNRAPPSTWTATCHFDRPGTYQFLCPYHFASMKGTVVVQDVAATPSATPTAGPTSTPGPGATPTPEPGSTPPAPQSTLKGAITLARSQHGSRVRGSVKVKAAKSRLEVGVWVPKSKLSGGTSHKAVRIGRYLKRSTTAGRVSFSIKVDATARKALRRSKRLALSVSVALTPPQGHKLTRSLHATLRG